MACSVPPSDPTQSRLGPNLVMCPELVYSIAFMTHIMPHYLLSHYNNQLKLYKVSEMRFLYYSNECIVAEW